MLISSFNSLQMLVKNSKADLYECTSNEKKERKSESEVAQSCLTLCDTMDCSLPGSSVLGIFQARILEWVVIPIYRGSSQLREQNQVSSSPALQADSLPAEPLVMVT